MEQQPFLTIGIASYNYGRYLKEAFEHIKKQTFTDFEVLYCDDESTDNSVEVIHQIIAENRDMKIRLVSGRNVGVMGNKNRIIENARGKYLMFCDADDWMEDFCLDVLCNKAKMTDADQVSGAFRTTNGNPKEDQIQDIPDHMSKWVWMSFHASIYKMEIIQDHHIRLDPKYYPDDGYFNMIFHKYSQNEIFINKVVYNWRMHDDSSSSIHSNEDTWHGLSFLHTCLPYIYDIWDVYRKSQSKEMYEIEYAAVKLYYLSVFYRNCRVSFHEFYNAFQKMHDYMIRFFPVFLTNPFVIKRDAGGIVRIRTAQVIYFGAFFERMHFMRVFLWLFWVVSHFHEFGI